MNEKIVSLILFLLLICILFFLGLSIFEKEKNELIPEKICEKNPGKSFTGDIILVCPEKEVNNYGENRNGNR